MGARPKHIVGDTVKAGPEIEAEILAVARSDHVDVPQAHALDDAEPVMLGLREDCANGVQELVGEVLEPPIGRGLQDDAVLHHEDAPGFVPGPVLPALLLDDLYGYPTSRSEDELLNLAGALDGKPVAAEFLLNGRNVVAHLADGTESDLSQDQHQRLIGQRNVPATAFQRAHLTQNLTPEERRWLRVDLRAPRKGRVHHAESRDMPSPAVIGGRRWRLGFGTTWAVP